MSTSATPQPEATRRVWPWMLLLLLAPVLVLWRQDNALFTGAGYIDPWLYYGYFVNLAEFKRTLYFGTYYGSRLSWVLPGWAAHALLPPMAASVVLHLAVHAAAVLGLFTTLRLAIGLRTAFLTALLFSLHSWLWMATGWDCVDGAGLAYCLLALAWLAMDRARPRRWLVAAAGAALAGAVFTNLFLVVVAPVVALSHVALLRVRDGAFRVRHAVSAAAWMAAGAVALTLVLSVINYGLDGHFWFYAPSVLAAMRLMSAPNPWFRDVWGAHGLPPYLWVAAIALLASLAALADFRRGFTVRPVLAAQFLAVFAAEAYLQSRGTPTLVLAYYASYLLPFAFLALGAIFFAAAERMRPFSYAALCVLAAAASAVVWGDYRAVHTPAWPRDAAMIATVSAVLLAAAFLLRRRGAGVLLAAAGLLLATAEARSGTYADPHLNRMAYERLIHARSAIEAARGGQSLRFAFRDSDPAAADFYALSSTYIGSILPAGRCEDGVEPGMLIVAGATEFAAGAEQQRRLADCWTPLGMRPMQVGAETLTPRGRRSYTLTLLRLEADSAARRPVVAPPLGEWRAASGAQAQPESGGVRLRTPAAGYALALASPVFVAPAAGHYRFALRYRMGSGHIEFGALPESGEKWKRSDVEERRLGAEEELAFWVELDAGERIRLGVGNFHWASHPSDVTLMSLSALYTPRP